MTDNDRLALWQATFDMAVYQLEKRTGLQLTGLSPSEMTLKVKEWAGGNNMSLDRVSYPEQPAFPAKKLRGGTLGKVQITNT